MARVVLHIGTHKTATTTLQDTLAANRALLADQGIVYPRIGKATGHHTLATHWIDLPKVYYEPAPAAQHWRELACHAGGDATVILSSEEFSRWRPQAVDFAELVGFLAPFAEKTVVCFLRNQLAFVQSVYLEVTKKGPVTPFDRLVEACLANDHVAGLFLDYGRLYDHVAAGFPDAEILFLSYEAAARHPGGFVAYFLERLGLAARTEPPPKDSNVSPDALALWVAGQVAAPAAADKALVALVEATLAETFPDRLANGHRTTLYIPSEAARIAARFEPINRRFEARYRRRDPDFALAPVALGGTPIYRNQLGNPFWVRLIRKLRNSGYSRAAAPA